MKNIQIVECFVHTTWYLENIKCINIRRITRAWCHLKLWFSTTTYPWCAMREECFRKSWNTRNSMFVFINNLRTWIFSHRIVLSRTSITLHLLREHHLRDTLHEWFIDFYYNCTIIFWNGIYIIHYRGWWKTNCNSSGLPRIIHIGWLKLLRQYY